MMKFEAIEGRDAKELEERCTVVFDNDLFDFAAEDRLHKFEQEKECVKSLRLDKELDWVSSSAVNGLERAINSYFPLWRLMSMMI